VPRMAAPADADEIRAILQAAVQTRGSQRDLARHLGFTEVHTSRLLTGTSGLSLPNLFAILDYVGMTLILAEPDE
jgi:plasmid maintenance system antidote protein VapI